MRMARIWMPLLLGGLFLTEAVLAQSPGDEEQGATEELTPSNSKGAVLTQSPEDEGQGPAYQAPGVHVWMGRYPSKVELQSALTQARSQAKSLSPAVSNQPDFQNGSAKFYIRKFPNTSGR